jgi:beta-ring hydroxylase
MTSYVFLFSFCECVCFAGLRGLSSVTCAYSNGREPDSVDDGLKSVERLPEEKRRAELSARIASGEFTVEQSGYT